MLRRALTIAFVVAAIVVGSTGSAVAATPLGPSLERASAQGDLIMLINAYRASNGLQTVTSNGALVAAAAWMAGDMAAKNYIGHVSSDGRSPTQRMSAFGYPATSMYTGEDLGAGYATASAVLAGWQASAAHNAVLLNPSYDAIGIGLVYDPRSTYKWYWAADFGGAGGTAKVVVPPTVAAPKSEPATERVAASAAAAERAAPAPRNSVAQPAEETLDPEARARAERLASIEAMARRIAQLFLALDRMGAI